MLNYLSFFFGFLYIAFMPKKKLSLSFGEQVFLFKGDGATVSPAIKNEKDVLLVRYKSDGKLLRRFFSWEKVDDANAFASQKNSEFRELGKSFGTIAPNEQRALAVYRGYVKDCLSSGNSITSLEDMVRGSIEREKESAKTPLFSVVADEYQAFLEKQGVGARHEHTSKLIVKKLSALFSEEQIGDLTVKGMERALFSMTRQDGKLVSAQTIKNHKAVLHAVFKYAVNHAIVPENPVERMRTPKAEGGEIGIITPDELKVVLKVCLEKKPYMLLPVVLGAFCGIRRSELKRLRYGDVTEKEVSVPAKSAKTKVARFIELPECAKSWISQIDMTSHASDEFILPGEEEPKREGFYNRGKQAVEKLSGVELPDNAFRHSFASHACALYEDYSKVAAILGHRGGIDVLMNHYRNAVRKEQGREWFEVLKVY